MAQSRLSDVLPQRKRIAHVPISPKPTTSKADVENQRKAELDILKKFDLTLEYGPCLGITRMERWERAQKHGLNPPLAVKDLILLNQKDECYVERFLKSRLYQFVYLLISPNASMSWDPDKTNLWYDYNTLK